MYRRWRPVVGEFAADELLYRRFRREHTHEGVILPSALQFPKKDENSGQSVNRSKLSKAEDALWTDKEKLIGLGVFEFPVSCLPREIVCPSTARCFNFWPKHVPLTKNYAHSEIWSGETPRTTSNYVLPTKIVCKELRAVIQKHSRIVIPPQL